VQSVQNNLGARRSQAHPTPTCPDSAGLLIHRKWRARKISRNRSFHNLDQYNILVFSLSFPDLNYRCDVEFIIIINEGDAGSDLLPRLPVRRQLQKSKERACALE
jgi:hypothetical protein